MSDAVSAPPWMAIDSTTAVSLRNTRPLFYASPRSTRPTQWLRPSIAAATNFGFRDVVSPARPACFCRIGRITCAPRRSCRDWAAPELKAALLLHLIRSATLA
jgi:hypothetical protein